MYAGGAIGVGAVAYFVYSFFKKPSVIPFGNSTITLGEDTNTSNAGSVDGASAFTIGQQTDFGDITAPDVIGKKYTVTDINGLK